MNQEPRFEKISEDDRGANYRVVLPTGQEIVFIFTKKGEMRGGHSHSVDEISLLLSGRAKYRKVSGRTSAIFRDSIYEFEQVEGRELRNDAGEIHLMEALTDNWIMDFKIGVKAGEWTTENYEPFRKLIKSHAP